MKRHWLCSLALGLCLLGQPASALGDDAGELKRARAQFQRATELEQAGNWTAALQSFREVGQVRMTPQVRFHIAVCEENLGRLLAALGGYELALAGADQVGPDFEAEVEATVRQLRQRIPKLVLRRGAGAATAAIELDGVVLGDSSLGSPVPLDPGPHAVIARAANREPFETSVTLAERETKELEVRLAPLQRPPSPSAHAEPNSTQDAPSKLVPLLIGGVGIASLATSGVLFALRQGALSDLEQACGQDGKHCPPSQEQRYAQLKGYHYGAAITLGAGVAALATAGVLLLLRSPDDSESRTALELAPSLPLDARTPLGASLQGAF